jgi:RNA polymerase sigma-70 factor (ECF subfamily)
MPEDSSQRSPGIHELVDHLFRRQAAQMVSTLTRVLGAQHLSLAEEAMQDALVTALQQWPFGGVPKDPAAWLYQVARNRALDRLRHARTVHDKEPALRSELGALRLAFARSGQAPDDVHPEVLLAAEAPPVDDDQLGMMFMTCHPVLRHESRVALTLKIVGGFSTGEIARAFLAQESTIAQRIVRAKRLLRDHDVSFGPPAAQDLQERLDVVLEAVYLMFNEGYAATAGDTLVREDISSEAIRLAALLTRHPITGTPKAWALLALLLLQAARFPARVSADGELFVLRDQDRSKWDRTLISEGMRALDRAARGDKLTHYHVEAEIAACHAVAESWEQTDWPRICALYDLLADMTKSPIVALNRAIARGRVAGPHAAIADVHGIASHPALASYHLLPAVLAELWREAGDAEKAAGYYREALKLATAAPEQRFLAARLHGL